MIHRSPTVTESSDQGFGLTRFIDGLAVARRLGGPGGVVRKAVVETRGRHGTFIAATTDAHQDAAKAAAEYVQRIRRLGMADEEALRLVAAALGGNAG
jgi:hypothetical protein